MSAAIELTGITKRFPGVIANDNVNLTVEKGEIHAICGENGAGKSTLMKILYGMQPADEGTMKVNGEEVVFSSPTDAIERGIGMVHQHFMLADQLTVLENIILGAEPTTAGGAIKFKEAEAHLAEVAEDYGLTIDPDDMVESLEVGERQRVEIIKVLYRGAEILILDEPTAVLVPQEVEALFDNMRELKAGGATIIFIDHKLDEVLEISDSITVLRHGKTVASMPNEGVTAHDLAELMVGSELPTPDTTESTVTNQVALDIVGLSVGEEQTGASATQAIDAHTATGGATSKVVAVQSVRRSLDNVSVDLSHCSATTSRNCPCVSAAKPALVTCPRIVTTRASCSMRRCGRTQRLAIKRRNPTAHDGC